MLLLVLAMLFSCSHAKDQPSPTAAPDPISAKWAEAADRLMAMADDGWVVSRYDDGRLERQGDSLIWTGIALGTLDCARAKNMEAALFGMLDQNQGRLWRHPAIPNDWSLDGAIGFYYGVIQHARRCPETAADWAPRLAMHAVAIRGDPRLVPRFELLLAAAQGLTPSETDRGELGAEVAAWAAADVAAKAPAYRLHLGWLALRSIDAPRGRDAYCIVVDSAAMPLIENFCGRDGLKTWTDQFQYDQMEYKHQRAVWESEAQPAGLHTPALDLLVALRELYVTDAVLLN